MNQSLLKPLYVNIFDPNSPISVHSELLPLECSRFQSCSASPPVSPQRRLLEPRPLQTLWERWHLREEKAGRGHRWVLVLSFLSVGAQSYYCGLTLASSLSLEAWTFRAVQTRLCRHKEKQIIRLLTRKNWTGNTTRCEVKWEKQKLLWSPKDTNNTVSSSSLAEDLKLLYQVIGTLLEI